MSHAAAANAFVLAPYRLLGTKAAGSTTKKTRGSSKSKSKSKKKKTIDPGDKRERGPSADDSEEGAHLSVLYPIR